MQRLNVVDDSAETLPPPGRPLWLQPRPAVLGGEGPPAAEPSSQSSSVGGGVGGTAARGKEPVCNVGGKESCRSLVGLKYTSHARVPL